MDKEKKLNEIKNLIETAELSLQQARKIMVDLVGSQEEKQFLAKASASGSMAEGDEGKIIQGVFDGQNMVGPDGKKYSVPANYASKSKLIEGDQLKLTIKPDGSFVYKQIKLLERKRIVGTLAIDEETNEYRVVAGNRSYKVLTASVTYFKGEEGNKVTILIPQEGDATWAAVENIYKSDELPDYLVQEEKQQDQQAESSQSQESPQESVPSLDNQSSQADLSKEDLPNQSHYPHQGGNQMQQDGGTPIDNSNSDAEDEVADKSDSDSASEFLENNQKANSFDSKVDEGSQEQEFSPTTHRAQSQENQPTETKLEANPKDNQPLDTFDKIGQTESSEAEYDKPNQEPNQDKTADIQKKMIDLINQTHQDDQNQDDSDLDNEQDRQGLEQF